MLSSCHRSNDGIPPLSPVVAVHRTGLQSPSVGSNSSRYLTQLHPRMMIAIAFYHPLQHLCKDPRSRLSPAACFWRTSVFGKRKICRRCLASPCHVGQVTNDTHGTWRGAGLPRNKDRSVGRSRAARGTRAWRGPPGAGARPAACRRGRRRACVARELARLLRVY